MPILSSEITPGVWQGRVFEMELVGDMWLEVGEASGVKRAPRIKPEHLAQIEAGKRMLESLRREQERVFFEGLGAWFR